jgi:hypothetical protein
VAGEGHCFWAAAVHIPGQVGGWQRHLRGYQRAAMVL